MTAAGGTVCARLWLCGAGAGVACGKYFLMIGWNNTMTRKVSAKTRSSRRSMPGSCWGFWNSAKFTFSMTAKLGFATAPNRRTATCRLDCFQTDHWIEPALRQRVASQHAPDRHETTPRNPITIDRFHGVLGAGRHIPASGQEHGRDRPFICSKYTQRDGLGNLVHRILPGKQTSELCSGVPILLLPPTFELLQKPGQSRLPIRRTQV